MIDAKSLRIGNWVNFTYKHNKKTKSRPYQVISINTEFGCCVKDLGHTMQLMDGGDPIPLTPELLVQAGFKKFSHEPGYKLGDDFEKDEKCDEYSLGKLTIMDWGNGFVMSNSFSFDLRVELKTLHQLQNLYFSLTGTELEITL